MCTMYCVENRTRLGVPMRISVVDYCACVDVDTLAGARCAVKELTAPAHTNENHPPTNASRAACQ